MNRAKIVLVCLLVLAIGVVSSPIKLADANPGTLITIHSDGSVTPDIGYLRQEGRVYYLTQNLSQARLVINCSDIVFDGQGYTINGSYHFVLGGKGIDLKNVNNVTIRNSIVIGFYEPSISLFNCSNVAISRVQTDAKGTIAVDIAGCIWLEHSNNNTVSNCKTGIRLQSGSNNRFFDNTLYIDILSSNNFFYSNNFYVYYASNGFKFPITGLSSVNSWNNGLIGNYWSDYNGSGVYFIDQKNIDHYPLPNPVDTTADTPTPTPTPTAYLTPSNRNAPHLELIDYLLPISIIIVITLISVLLYRRRRKTA